MSRVSYDGFRHCTVTDHVTVWVLFIATLFALISNIPLVQAEEAAKKAYPETVAVLQMLHVSEIRARDHYLAFADKALKEGHTNIAHLFIAIADSEKVHAGNFRRILKGFGVQPAGVKPASVEVSTTKNNLKYATKIELAEIDKDYPRYIKRIKPEMHDEALEYITYAWQAEQQHRDLIKEIQSGTGMFYSMLLKYFRSNPSKFYVNQNCGTTVRELPEDACPICHQPL
ncbi:MAG: rubrerythrin family protein, partial [Mariprofundaceae bacterium]